MTYFFAPGAKTTVARCRPAIPPHPFLSRVIFFLPKHNMKQRNTCVLSQILGMRNIPTLALWGRKIYFGTNGRCSTNTWRVGQKAWSAWPKWKRIPHWPCLSGRASSRRGVEGSGCAISSPRPCRCVIACCKLFDACASFRTEAVNTSKSLPPVTVSFTTECRIYSSWQKKEQHLRILLPQSCFS